MNQKAISFFILALIFMGYATTAGSVNANGTEKSKETNLQKIEKMVGGKVMMFGGTYYYPWHSSKKRIRLLVQKNESYEIRFVDVEA